MSFEQEYMQDLAAEHNTNQQKTNTMEVIHLTPQLWQTTQINELAEALAEFAGLLQKESIKKDAKSHRNQYISLDNIIHTVRPILAKLGLSVSQDLAGDFLVTTLMHKSGQFKGSAMPFNPMQGGNVNALQAIGGGISYAKRYAISALLGISSDVDDDAEGMKDKKITAPKVEDSRQRIKDDKIPNVIKNAKAKKMTIKDIEEELYLEPLQKAEILKGLKA